MPKGDEIVVTEAMLKAGSDAEEEFFTENDCLAHVYRAMRRLEPALSPASQRIAELERERDEARAALFVEKKVSEQSLAAAKANADELADLRADHEQQDGIIASLKVELRDSFPLRLAALRASGGLPEAQDVYTRDAESVLEKILGELYVTLSILMKYDHGIRGPLEARIRAAIDLASIRNPRCSQG